MLQLPDSITSAASAVKAARTSVYIDTAISVGIKVGGALVILLLGMWLARRLANVAERALGRAKLDTTLTGFLRKLIYGVLVAFLIVTALGVLGVPSAPMVTALGTAGLAIGLALQGSLSNLAWGVLLIVFRPFAVGDFVEAAGVTGTVQSINLMHTVLYLPDGRESILPNGKIGATAITNFNRRGSRRFELSVGIGYGDDIGAAMAEIRKVCEADERILKDPAPGVWTTGLGESSVDLLVRAWAATPDFWSTQHDTLRAIKEALDAAGISIPFPQREMSVVHSVAPGTPLAITEVPPDGD